jgi:hypothetical protein
VLILINSCQIATIAGSPGRPAATSAAPRCRATPIIWVKAPCPMVCFVSATFCLVLQATPPPFPPSDYFPGGGGGGGSIIFPIRLFSRRRRRRRRWEHTFVLIDWRSVRSSIRADRAKGKKTKSALPCLLSQSVRPQQADRHDRPLHRPKASSEAVLCVVA